MSKFKRRFLAALGDHHLGLKYLSMELNSLFSDPNGRFISNLIPGALNHLTISVPIILVLSFIVEMAARSNNASFLQVVLLYPFFVIITLLLSIILLILLSLIESFAKLFASLYFYEAPYDDGTIFDTAIASFFTGEGFLDTVFGHDMKKFNASLQQKKRRRSA